MPARHSRFPTRAQPTAPAPRCARATAAQAGLCLLLALVLSAAMEPAYASEQAQLRAAQASAGDELGFAVGRGGTQLATGVPGANQSTGAVELFDCAVLPCAPKGRLAAADLQAGDSFGAAIAMDAGNLLVGAPNQGAGAVYVYVAAGLAWSLQAKLVPSGGQAGDLFGAALAFDTDTLVVGASRADVARGAAYVFVRSGGSWTQQARLVAGDRMKRAEFGRSVAVSGSTALIGTPYFESAGLYARGAAYAFVRNAGSWSQQARLLSGSAASGAVFGYAVALNNDRALIGAPLAASEAGRVQVFLRSGASWVEQAEIFPLGAVAGDRFGWSLALGSDHALIGAPFAHTSGGCGAAYVFADQGPNFAQAARLLPRDPDSDNFFGWSLAGNQQQLIVGSPGALSVGAIRGGSGHWFDSNIGLFDDGMESAPAGCLP